jgi:hypothetical protein
VHARRRLGRRLFLADRAHLLDLPVDLAEAEPATEGERAVVAPVDVRGGGAEADGAQVRGELEPLRVAVAPLTLLGGVGLAVIAFQIRT